MITAKAFLTKVVRMRKMLVKTNKSKLPVMAMTEAMKPLELWMQHFPNASEEACKKQLLRYQENIILLIPGQGCKTHKQLMEEFNQLTQIQNSIV
jgi:hypothetical protein